MVIEESIKPVKIGDRYVGPGHPIFFIAEIGLNHNQDLDIAKRLIDVAVEAGCSAAKFQTFRTEDVYVQRNLAGTYHLMEKEIPIYDLHVGLEMSEEWIFTLKEYCDERNIVFFSAPIGRVATELLDKAGSATFKISSYECSNIPFLRYVASKKKPVVLSTGAAMLGEVEEAVNCITSQGAPLVMMQCITKYPAQYHCANLAIIHTFKHAFRVPTGFSDNGFEENGQIDYLMVPTAAAQAGADLFEIHITLDRKLPGPDHGFATEPDELKKMIKQMNDIREEYNQGKRFEIDPVLWGTSIKRTLPEEQYVRDFAYKCIFAVKDLKPGDKFTKDNICVLRPGEYKRGLDPKYYDLLVEKAIVSRHVKCWEPITWELLLS